MTGTFDDIEQYTAANTVPRNQADPSNRVSWRVVYKGLTQAAHAS
jgi:hypothetical protein